jgi:hypothetical protein
MYQSIRAQHSESHKITTPPAPHRDIATVRTAQTVVGFECVSLADCGAMWSPLTFLVDAVWRFHGAIALLKVCQSPERNSHSVIHMFTSLYLQTRSVSQLFKYSLHSVTHLCTHPLHFIDILTALKSVNYSHTHFTQSIIQKLSHISLRFA